MTDLQILFQLELTHGKVLTLEQSLEVLGRVKCTIDVLEGEGHECDKDYEIELIRVIASEVLDEQ